MSSRFRLSHFSLAFIAAFSSPALLADALERERDKVPIEATDLPVDGTPQALELEVTRVLGGAGRVDPGPGAQPVHGPAAGVQHGLRVHLPQPGG
ncbi:hypothetical protein PSTG_19342, partial [Puccinia striiformis f. sp. tritici PST-78]